LKVIFDKRIILHMNPGACGKSGFHQVTNHVALCIDGDKIKELEIEDGKAAVVLYLIGVIVIVVPFWA
jgi:uncharacterized protein (DUF983 family)